ncbi:MAG: endonuclease V [Clostridia bacterium]|nr:endonuclease V [Clostridia bacterium]
MDYQKEIEFSKIQEKLRLQIEFTSIDISKINSIAGIDVAYFTSKEVEYGCCSIVVLEFPSLKVIEIVDHVSVIYEPYVPGYLSFRELPVVLEAIEKVSENVDLFMFDGNGYLHPKNMGIATHASFYIHKPCIGVAKNYFKIFNIDFTMPKNTFGATTNISNGDEVLGVAMRSRINCNPIFVSCGNYITLEECVEIVKRCILKESRIPVPTRYADIQTHKLRKEASEKVTKGHLN